MKAGRLGDAEGEKAGAGAGVRWAIAAALFGLTLLLFSRAWQNDFVNYDDPDYVTANAHVKAGLTLDGVMWALRSGEASNWHPLTWVSHMIDVSLFGLNPRGHHATSVVLHALNAALAFVAFWRLTGAVGASALCAALFAWHPLRVESVAWVAERKDVLSAMFGFLTLWAYACYARGERPETRDQRPGTSEREWAGTGRVSGRWYCAVLGFFALGLMAKPMLVTLPCLLLVLDVWPLRRIGWEAKVGADLRAVRQDTRTPTARPEVGPYLGLLLEKLPLFALVIGSAVVTYLVQKGGGSVSETLTLGQRLGNAVVAVVRYLGKFFAPAELAVLYPHPGDWPARKVVASLVIVAAVTALGWWQRRRRPWVLVGWLWFLGTLVPVIGLVQVGLQAMADRYTYFPILGVQLALLWTLREWWPKARTALAIAAAAVLVGCAVLTWRQIGVWRNSFTLFDHAIAVTEKNYLAHNNRAIWLCDNGRVEEGIADYRRALSIRPDYPEANNNLGRLLVQQGRSAEAVPLLRQALAGKAGSLEVRNNLANALSDVGALDEAIEHYEAILAREPRHANALNGLGVALAMKGRPAEARAKIEESLRLAPDNAGAHSNLGNVFSMLGQFEDAVRHYRRATELQPDAHTLLQLANALAQLGRRDEAIAALKDALRLRPDHPQAKAMLDALAGGARSP